jgi:hypothetical protein
MVDDKDLHLQYFVCKNIETELAMAKVLISR